MIFLIALAMSSFSFVFLNKTEKEVKADQKINKNNR